MATETVMKKTIYVKYLYGDEPFRLTLNDLLPLKLRKKLAAETAERSEANILSVLLPAEYRRMPDGTDLAELKGDAFTRFLTCRLGPKVEKARSGKAGFGKTETEKPLSESQYRAVGDNMIRESLWKEGFQRSDFTLPERIRKQMNIILADLPEAERRDLDTGTAELLGLLKESPYTELAAHADEIRALPSLEERLAYLVVAALTWSCWSDPLAAKRLAFLLFASAKEEKRLKEEKASVDSLLTQCREKLRKADYEACGEIAERLLSMSLVPDAVLGEASYLLALCCEHGFKKTDSVPDGEALMLQAARFGCREARASLSGKYIPTLHIMDTKYLYRPFRITLAGLFPAKLRERMAAALAKQEGAAPKDEDRNSQQVLLRGLLPAEYSLVSDKSDLARMGSASASRFFTGHAEAENQYCVLGDNILELARKAGFEASDFTLLPDICEKLRSMLADLTDPERRALAADADELFDELHRRSKKYPQLAQCAEELQKLELEEALACLTIIAMTWPCWSRQIKASALANLLFRQKERKVAEPDAGGGIALDDNGDRAESLLQKCREAFSDNRYPECSKAAEEIITLWFVPDAALGEAYYWLSLCCSDHGCKSPEHTLDAKGLMLRAARFGCKEAYDVLRSKYGLDEAPLLLRPGIKASHGVVRVVANTVNRYTEAFLQSAPEEMRKDAEKDAEKLVKYADNKKALQETVDSSRNTRYLLFDDDQEKNFQHLLYILDGIASAEHGRFTDPEKATKRWSGTTISIRVSEERYGALIDTALKRLGSFIVRVFILDDAKCAAQTLLAEHPLYDLIRGKSEQSLREGSVTIRFTVISAGNTPLTGWLLREAYWLGTFAYQKLRIKIELISPAAEEIKNALRMEAPAMFGELPEEKGISSVEFLKNNCALSSLEDYRLMGYINRGKTTVDTFDYYVVDAGDDVSNLNLAIRLREWDIRDRVRNGRALQSQGQPTIAFYCREPDIAYLAENMAVQSIDHGSSWYNNYNLIPFGLLPERYSWDNIDGGYWERVAESTQLQYCGVAPDADDSTKNANLVDYFARTYNRDSSMAVALYLPYRMFQLRTELAEHIVCEERFSSTAPEEKNIRLGRSLAEQFRAALEKADKSATDGLARAEHARWVRWAYSRGWEPAVPEQVLAYMKAGNPKQQLYIARLHGCLCSSEELAVLAQRMLAVLDPDDDRQPHEKDWQRFAGDRKARMYRVNEGERAVNCGYDYSPKDFTAIDYSNVMATADLIEARWSALDDIVRVPERTEH